ncbi:MAG: glycosyltransferase family 2 protein [Candidatus Kapabacteria bacterium]|nr:glycosyltransferase family 2 protein [Ignavibacteriota bacterium]MCW5886066.1 glycosyltransferase family 2 protein [Candidatus Kapabacteria bacterium]
MSYNISLVIPAYNEEQRLADTLKSVLQYVSEQSLDVQIIVVDDGSSDKTSEVAGSFSEVTVITLPKNMGKGAAVRAGMLAANCDYRFFSDADLSTPIYELPKLLNPLLRGIDVCVGSRALNSKMIKVHQPFYREFMGKTFNKIVQLLVVKGIKDTQCGFKGFSAQAAEKIFSNTKIDGFSFDVEAIYLAKKFGFSIEEIPVEWYNDERSKVDPIKDSIRMFKEILKIRNLHK